MTAEVGKVNTAMLFGRAGIPKRSASRLLRRLSQRGVLPWITRTTATVSILPCSRFCFPGWLRKPFSSIPVAERMTLSKGTAGSHIQIALSLRRGHIDGSLTKRARKTFLIGCPTTA